ncbi:MAG: VWA domain-containing protein [Gemmatimonadaceae bacterium]
MHLSLRTDRTLLRSAGGSTRYLMISLAAPTAAPRAGRLPVNVALVLDRSGSMDGERKFELAREAVEQALRLLRPEDRFTLVVYDTEVDVLVPTTLATAEAKDLAFARLQAIGPRGSTDLHGGWTRGASEIAAQMSHDSVNRVLLLTDGLANHGVTEHGALVAKAGELRRRGIATTTFGVGADFDERLLRDIAHEGGGNFYFIETPAQIADLLTSELGEALEVVVREAVLHVELPVGAEAEPLNRNRFSRDGDGGELRVELGDLTSAQNLHVVLRIRFRNGEPGDVARVGVRVRGRDTTESQIAMCEWRYASHVENDAQSRDRIVDRAVAALYAARARAEATEANRHGDFRRAREVLEVTVRRVRSYAGDDEELEATWRALRSDISRFTEAAMSPMQLKSALFVAESARRNRAPDGKARRSK